ncbi:MAG: type IX secretion system outer membrane channel protein PorV [Bacteroidales bacterium]|nr:type IX secretion system outer membrane channel protein PorV [Bacteroidales bacterium]
MKLFFFKSAVLFSAIAVLFNSPANAQGSDVDYGDILGQRVNTITTAVPFLMIAPDARSGAMGDVGVSTRPDANSMHWNPAKYAFVEQDMGLTLNYTPWLRNLVNDINLSYLSGFMRIDELQTVAASLVFFSLGDIQFTDEAGNPQGIYRPSEFAIDMAYARKLGEHISGGIAVRYIHSNLTQGQDVGSMETRPGRALAADVSVYYQRELDWRTTPANFSWGVNISNIGNKISYSDDINSNFIPINLRLGPTLSLDLDAYNSIAFSLDLNKLLVPTPPIYARDESGQVIVDADNNYVIQEGRDPNRSVVAGMFGSFNDAPGGFREELQELTYGAGIEYWYDRQFAIRGGYFHEHENKGNRKYFTLGLGLKYNVFGLDFSYIIPVMQRSPLENVLRFSLSFDFDAIAAPQDRR